MNRFLPTAYSLLLTAFCILLIASSCKFRSRHNDLQVKEEKTIASKIEMMDTDRAFSVMSEKEGLRKAYTEYIDSSGVLLRPNSLPLTGGDAVDFITQTNDSSFIMTWDPKDAAIAVSGDMGYTYGVYSVQQKGQDSVVYGSYVTIWKKQPDGKWKFVLQSGNEGVE